MTQIAKIGQLRLVRGHVACMFPDGENKLTWSLLRTGSVFLVLAIKTPVEWINRTSMKLPPVDDNIVTVLSNQGVGWLFGTQVQHSSIVS